MQYINHQSLTIYSGDRPAHWRDIPVTSERPGPDYVPVIEGGEHVGWDHQPPELTLDDYRAAIEAHVDAVARERDFRHADSARGHINSTVQAWREDAEAFIAWADNVWLYAFAELDNVLAGQRPQPTVEDLIAELPTIEWPPAP